MPKKNDNAVSEKRDQLIDTALRLFARHGYRATALTPSSPKRASPR
jgi:AcrR family transcriptional regulator